MPFDRDLYTMAPLGMTPLAIKGLQQTALARKAVNGGEKVGRGSGAKPGQWRGAKRHGPGAHQIAGVGHGALARRAKPAAVDQAVASAFWARL